LVLLIRFPSKIVSVAEFESGGVTELVLLLLAFDMNLATLSFLMVCARLRVDRWFYWPLQIILRSTSRSICTIGSIPRNPWAGVSCLAPQLGIVVVVVHERRDGTLFYLSLLEYSAQRWSVESTRRPPF
jgi:hypothetical protein